MSEEQSVFVRIERDFGKHGPTVVTSLIVLCMSALILLAGGLLLPYFAAGAMTNGAATGTVINMLTMVIGGLIGWIAAILATPYSQNEASRLSTLAKAISAFLSGYVLSKFDRVLERTLSGAGGGLTQEAWQLLGFFFGAFLIGFLAIFTTRAYFRKTQIGVRS
ncbi:hypothetical protein LQ564_12580 [Massilia sp. G4R7]|uniref:MotA/TolQ/ExbB proton channel domain-containing protein n=1 Tax=Massilia phyllostachyos TaxID=2898585 RepID=A0ABS8Q5X9_9BURK|nr:hypothetical protein [Massilia phyllostachyos]MCD2517142.1 hypothetical protein [Massilia phyllostachyos]